MTTPTDYRALCAEMLKAWDSEPPYDDSVASHDAVVELLDRARALLSAPEAVGDVHYEFIVSDAETDEPQASGEASTLEEAQREGRHYLAMYEEDGPMRLEVREVRALPLPGDP